MRFIEWQNSFIDKMNLDKKDRELIRLCYRDVVTADEMANIFNGIIFEDHQYDVCCLIAQLCSKHNYVGTPEQLTPKIKGLIRYLKTMNAFRVVELFKFIKELNQADIPVMLMKGIAIHIGYYPKFNRYMADTDVYVAMNNYDKTVKLARDYGCTGISNIYSADLKKGALAVDIHRVFAKELLNGANPDGIWLRATKTKQNGVSFFVPSREDMIVQILITGFYNVLERSWDKEKKHIKWIIDILPFLLDNEKTDWKEVVLIAEQLKISDQMKIMLLALGEILPQSINIEELIGYFSQKEVTSKAICFFDKVYNLNSIQFKSGDFTKSIPEVILHWAKYSWVLNRYLCGHKNLFRAMTKYLEFCAVFMQIEGVKYIPGEITRKIKKRVRARHSGFNSSCP